MIKGRGECRSVHLVHYYEITSLSFLTVRPNTSHRSFSTFALFCTPWWVSWQQWLIITWRQMFNRWGATKHVFVDMFDTLNSTRPSPSTTTRQVELREFKACPDSSLSSHMFTTAQRPDQNEAFCFHKSLFWSVFLACLNHFFFSSSSYLQWDVFICPDWWGWKQAIWLLSPIIGMHLKCCCPLLSLIISYFCLLGAKIFSLECNFFSLWKRLCSALLV